MAKEVLEKDIWVLSPYCFCKDRNWLTVGDIYVPADSGEGGGGLGLAPISGLSRQHTALLAAFLTALALFLFLLFLLLCCLYPWGLCALCGGRGGKCCGKGGRAGKSKSQEMKSDVSSDKVNLTAVDMKIPRAWTDSQDDLSEAGSFRNRHDKGWKSLADVDEMDWKADLEQSLLPSVSSGQKDHTNDAFQRKDFKSGWFSTADLDSVYGEKTSREKRSTYDGYLSDNEEIYRGKHNVSTPSYLSRSLNHLDSIMTYKDGGRHGQAVDSSRHLLGISGTGSIVEALTLTRTKALIRPMSNAESTPSLVENLVSGLTLSSSRQGGDFPSITAPLPYSNQEETQRQLATTTTAAGNDVATRSSYGVTSQQCNLNGNSPIGGYHVGSSGDHDIVHEYTSSFKRTVEETTTSG